MAATKSNKKTSGTPAKRGPGRPKKTNNQKRAKAEAQQSFIRAEIFIIGSFVLALLLFLSNFHMCGVIGEFFRQLQLGLFGAIGFVFPLLLFGGTAFFMSNRGNRTAAVKLAAVVGVSIALCGFAQLFFGKSYQEGMSILFFYQDSAVNGTGGGLLGGTLTAVLGQALGTAGTFLFLAAMLVIGVVCITEKSVVNVVKTGSGKAYQYAREDLDRRKELHAERQEERRRLREEQRVRGVDLESTKLVDPELSEETLPMEESLDALTASLEGNAVPESEETVSGPIRKADIFTGQIMLPETASMPDEEEMNESSVPFDLDNTRIIPTEDPQVDHMDTIYAEKETRTLEEMDVLPDTYPEEPGESGVNYDGFFIPEEPKKVVTASGKVIETDTEMLKKKLESKRAEAAEHPEDMSVQAQIQKKKQIPKKKYIFPPVSLLKRSSRIAGSHSEKEYKETAIKLQQTLQNFGVGVTVTNISCGPAVTRYELHPEQGVKVSKIVGLSDDIKLSLAAEDIRIEAPIPGKSAVGIEVPNKENSVVLLRDLLESDNFKKHPSRLAFAVGKDIGGQVVVADIAKMPHLLIAGATGSGKSVCINTLIMSIIYKSSPEDVKLIMVDPKVVELSVYNGIPHLLIPVVTDPKKASGALNWAVAEMTDRYKKFADYNVRDLKGYNEKLEQEREAAKKAGDEEREAELTKLPQIVIIVDELADLMMVAPGEVEDAICRLAQLARAAGIHLVIATQRPSVNVITGLIKANVPSRIAFSVSSGVDSRTIIDMNGAEKLLGKGDMLFYPAGFPKPQRVQGAFVSDSEVQQVVDFLTEQGMTTDYNPDVESQIIAPPSSGGSDGTSSRDEYFEQAGRFIIEKDKASIGMLQRMFKIGFNRAARIMDQLAEAGVVGEEEGTKPRKVLMTIEEFEQVI